MKLATLSREIEAIRGLLRVRKLTNRLKVDTDYLVADHLEDVCRRFANKAAILFEDQRWSYAELDAFANRVGRWALSQGFKPGEHVALMMQNRPEYIGIWFGLAKVGIVAALINHQLTGEALSHCVRLVSARALIVEGELAPQVLPVRGEFGEETRFFSTDGDTTFEPFEAQLNCEASDPLDRVHRAGRVSSDHAFKIFTSGTTGLPKAARITHSRALYFLMVFTVGLDAQPDDVMLNTLPLYHTTGGLCGVGFALGAGGTLALERRFSVSHFWTRAVETGATHFMYVGELCRFLVNSPKDEKERAHSIRMGLGNGMRPDVWGRFIERFGVDKIVEFYGATEGNVGLVNLDGRLGAIGRIPPYLQSQFNVQLVAFDAETEEPIRGSDGFCRRTRDDEVGEAIGRISNSDPRFKFDGYAGADEATRKKVLVDVFARGDRWFRTGDLMKRDGEGYFYFVDRVGDTFRWKSENVSTAEVAAVLGHVQGVEQANVYGVSVEGYDGRAGMAALLIDRLDRLEDIARAVDKNLPHYARPMILRLMQTSDEQMTGTFKFRKADYVKQGFDPEAIADPLYIYDAEAGYVRLTSQTYQSIVRGETRL
jgi:fatty-acyl-CoA synthase